MKSTKNIIMLAFIILLFSPKFFAQQKQLVKYFQMEPLDDSLFIKIQKEVFINPPDPKAEIIVDLRDPNNQTVSIAGTLYPFLAFTPETRAKIETYPFKINLEETINYGSVFTRVIERLDLKKIFAPPSYYQISSTLGYINPFIQLFGGERFGIPLKEDLGISVGLGTPYSGPLQTNFVDAQVHLLGFYVGGYTHNDAFITIRSSERNDLYASSGLEFGYVIPLGNFLELSYLESAGHFDSTDAKTYVPDELGNGKVMFINGSYFNWELRYPFRLLGSTRGKVYIAQFLNETHIGYTGREISMGGSTFDFSFDAMVHSKIREPQYVFNLMVQKIAESWGFSALALGPSFTLSKTAKGNLGVISIFLNLRLKVGTSF